MDRTIDLTGPTISDDLKQTEPIFSTLLPCRTIRIGSYRFVPKSEIAITSLGIRIQIPVINNSSQFYKLFIPIKYIVKVLSNFNKNLPVLFLYVTPSVAIVIRKKIHMEDGSNIYFDPLSKEEQFKRITLLPEVVSEDVKETIRKIFADRPFNMMEELSSKEANEILIRTCTKDHPLQNAVISAVTTTITNATNNNSNSTAVPAATIGQTQKSGVVELRQLLIYPPGKGGIAINTEDYMCLAQDQFLNDVIIDFYLKYLLTDVLSPLLQEKVFIFSSFFYKRLTTKPAKASKRSNPFEMDPTLSPAEKRHCRVKNWTKNVNIFEKDFIIIPINENSHWFLAIICFPGLDGCRSMKDENKVIKLPNKCTRKYVNKSITIGNTTITTVKSQTLDGSTTNDKAIKCEDDNDDDHGSDRDEADGDESELDVTDESESDESIITAGSGEIYKKTNIGLREPIKQPCILIFDSLAGASRTRVVATLRDYLTYEHRAKLSSTKTFSKDNMKGACPKVPQQMNFTDCGLYVLQYVEAFFKTPITDYHIPIKQLKNWFDEIVVTRKREEISILIRDLMIENKRDPNLLPEIIFPTLNGKINKNTSHPTDDEEEEDNEEEEKDERDERIEKEAKKTEKQQLRKESIQEKMEIDEQQSSIPLNVGATEENFIVEAVSNLKPDLSEISNISHKSNRDTMSYLKAKRIIRHRNINELIDGKKQKLDLYNNK